MTKLLLLTLLPTLACAVAPLSIPIWVQSPNTSEVDVFLLCGDREAQQLGVLYPHEAGQFEIPASSAFCPIDP